MKLFKDRQSAGKLLAKRIKQMSSDRGTIVLGIPRGGVVVAYEVAKELDLPLDIIVTRKIGAPYQHELALGAVDADGEITDGLKELEGLEEIIEREIKEIKRRENMYRQGKEQLKVENKAVILVDDGIATGATTLAAVKFLKRHGAKKIVLAVPVASREAVDKIREVGGVGVIVLEMPEDFQAVGQFYFEFEPVSDEEVIQYLHG